MTLAIAPTAPVRSVSALPVSLFPGGTTRPAHNSAEFTTALSLAVPNDTIVLDAGVTYTGNFQTPATAYSSGWITIVSSDEVSLPRPGTRVGLAHATSMPTIQTTNSDPALTIPDGSNGIRLVGLRIVASSSPVFTLVAAGSSTHTSGLSVNVDTQLGETTLTNRVAIERCIVTGTAGLNVLQVIKVSCRDATIRDNYIAKAHWAGFEAQGILLGGGPGPYLIENNYIEGAGENLMSGGFDTNVTNLIASDVIVQGNYFFKPLSWNPTDPSYGGIHYTVKNLFELKNAQRVIVRGNVFENCWTDAQTGDAILFDCFNQSGGNTWARIYDVDFYNNKIIGYSGAGFLNWNADTSSGAGTNTAGVKRLRIRNNLFIGSDPSSGSTWRILGSSLHPTEDLWIEHLTSLPCAQYTGLLSGPPNTYPRLNIRNCLLGFGNVGPVITPGDLKGDSNWDAVSPDRLFEKNGLLNLGSSDGAGPTRNNGTQGTGWLARGTAAAEGLQTSTGLLLSGSPLKAFASDGKDLGVDFTELDPWLVGVTAGTWAIPSSGGGGGGGGGASRTVIVSGGIIRGSRAGRAGLVPLPYTETWTVSDHAGLNGDKSWTMGAAGWTVASLAAQLTNNGSAASRGQCNVDCGTDDYAATLSLLTFNPDIVGTLAAGPCVRMPGDASLNFYTGVLASNGGSAPVAVLYKFVGGVQTQLGAISAPIAFHTGLTLTVRAVGSSIRLLVDGVPTVNATDTALPTGRFAGLQGVASGGNFVRVDNLNVVAATIGVSRVPLELLSLTPMAGVR